MDLNQIKELIKKDRLVRFYQSPAWRSLRQAALDRDNNECQECKRRGRVTSGPLTPGTPPTPANGNPEGSEKKKMRIKGRKGSMHVHHKKEVKEFPELALDINNIETLCISCHNDEHDRLAEYKQKADRFETDEQW